MTLPAVLRGVASRTRAPRPAVVPSPGAALAQQGPSSHVPALDGLRAIALLLVVLFHARIPGFSNGDLGVDVFFVLSGFLISGILLRSASRGRVSFADFYRRRALRLLPAYLTVLVVCVATDLLHDSGGTLKGAATSFFYVSNWAAAAGIGMGLLAHTWSLSIEEQFYLVWPLVLVALLARAHGDLRRVARTVGLLVLASYLSIVACLLLGGSVELAWNATTSRACELLAGCLLAVVVQRRRLAGAPAVGTGRRATGLVSFVGLLALLVVGSHNPADPWVEMLVQWPVVVALTVLLIIACVAGPNLTGTMLGWRPLVAVGKVSYGAYLWHFPVFVVVDSTLGLSTWAPRLLALAVTAVVVVLSYRFVEQPFLRMKDRSSRA
jgi:peptidoglycan/LPS O-acetylase OafA/YrhL